MAQQVLKEQRDNKEATAASLFHHHSPLYSQDASSVIYKRLKWTIIILTGHSSGLQRESRLPPPNCVLHGVYRPKSPGEALARLVVLLTDLPF